MSRAVVHDPKDAASRFIRLLAHDFAHKPIDGSNSTFDFTAAEDSCSMDIPGCQIGPGPHAEVLMLDVRGGLEYWSFRLRRGRNHRHPVERPPRRVGKDRGWVRLWQQSPDRGGRSSFDVSRGE